MKGHANITLLSITFSERNQHVTKARELLNDEAINCLQDLNTENSLVASGHLAILRCLATLLLTDRQQQSTKDVKNNGDKIPETVRFARCLLEGKSDSTGNEITLFQNIWLGNGQTLSRNIQTVIANYYSCEIKRMPVKNNNLDIGKLKKNLQKLDRSGRFIEQLRNAVFSNISPQCMTLISGFYIEMGWREPFVESLTTRGPFQISESERAEVEFMVLKSGLVCVTCDSIEATVLQLPLTANNMCMLLYLPQDKTKGLDNVIGNLTRENFERLAAKLTQAKPKPVYVTLPKFSLQQSMVMSGVSCPSEGNKTLPGCKIFQTSTLTVNEFGLNTSKTSQSEAIMTGPAVHAGIKWTQFTATSPFLFTIVDTDNMIIFTVGKITRPEHSEKVSREMTKTRNWCCI